MKKLCLATCITLAAAVLTAAPATVTAVIKDMPIYQPQNYSIRKGCSISNQHGQYTFTLVRTKALGKAKPDTQLRMNAGTWGFSHKSGSSILLSMESPDRNLLSSRKISKRTVMVKMPVRTFCSIMTEQKYVSVST